MIKRIGVLLLMAGSLLAYEDVSFSARTLGLGGDHAAVTDDAFAHIINPALPARWNRPVTAFSIASYQGLLYTSCTYLQPVQGLGSLGGTIFYRGNGFKEAGLYNRFTDTEARFIISIPAGRHFGLGLALGNYQQEISYDSLFGHSWPFVEPRSNGVFSSVGIVAVHDKGLTLGASIEESLFDEDFLDRIHVGFAGEPLVKPSRFLSSPMIAGEFAFKQGDVKIHVGGEVYLLRNHLGIRAGIRYGTDTLTGFSPTFGATFRSHQKEKTDVEFHYGTALTYVHGNEPSIFHQFSLAVFFGDARKVEKDSIKIAQAERARKLREQTLARERDKLRAELNAIEQERSALEAEREDIERLRHEALTALGRLRGVEFAENDTFIRITVIEAALKFGEDAAEIPFPQGYYTLDKVAGFLFGYPNNGIVVECHTNVGPSPEEESEEPEPVKYRDAHSLTTARAQNIRSYFTEVKGMSSSNITARGAGDSKPLVVDDAANPANRRVEITIKKTP
jgi:outer membrane protein OmpA-like peptidoglycan-associated protein